MFTCPETLAGVTTNLLAKERLEQARAEIGPEDVRPVPLDQCNEIIANYRGYREVMGLPGPGPDPFC